MTPNNETEVREAIDARFRSGNSVPVERTHITAGEWEAIKAALASVQTGGEAIGKLHLGTDALSIVASTMSMLREKYGPDEITLYTAPPSVEALQKELLAVEKRAFDWSQKFGDEMEKVEELHAKLTTAEQEVERLKEVIAQLAPQGWQQLAQPAGNVGDVDPPDYEYLPNAHNQFGRVWFKNPQPYWQNDEAATTVTAEQLAAGQVVFKTVECPICQGEGRYCVACNYSGRLSVAAPVPGTVGQEVK